MALLKPLERQQMHRSLISRSVSKNVKCMFSVFHVSEISETKEKTAEEGIFSE